jgi:YbbR domain-containing protein
MNHMVWLGSSHVRVPSDVEVLRIDPPNIPVLVEPLIRRQVAVKPIVNVDQLPSELAILGYDIAPAQVEISGPASEVEPLQEVLTQPINPPAETSNMMLTAPIQVPGQHVTLKPPMVNITVMLDEAVEKQFPNLKPGSLPHGRVVSPATVTVTLRGPKSLLDKMESRDMIVKLDTTKSSGDGREVSPVVELSERFRGVVSVMSITPEKLTMTSR